nr:uncharacterized protein LOC106680325 isoform X3 [Halyomorpha halys]
MMAMYRYRASSCHMLDIKQEEGPQINDGHMLDIKQEEGPQINDGHMLDIKKEEGPQIYDDGLVHVKEEEEEVVVPDNGHMLNIKQEEGPQIYYDGLIHVKEEKEVLVPDDGEEDSFNKIEVINNYALKAKMKMDFKKCNSQNTTQKIFQCFHCHYNTVRLFKLRKHIMYHHTGDKKKKAFTFLIKISGFKSSYGRLYKYGECITKIHFQIKSDFCIFFFV